MDDSKAAVLLEDLQAQFRTFGEGLDSLRDELKELRNDTSRRLDNLENKVTDFSIEFKTFQVNNKQEHEQLIQAIKETDTEVREIKRIK